MITNCQEEVVVIRSCCDILTKWNLSISTRSNVDQELSILLGKIGYCLPHRHTQNSYKYLVPYLLTLVLIIRIILSSFPFKLNFRWSTIDSERDGAANAFAWMGIGMFFAFLSINYS